MAKEERPDYCPGHEGKCKFCKEKKGRYIYIGAYKQVNRATKEPLIDYCCTKCQKNDEFAKLRSVDPATAAKLGGKVLKGDNL